MPPNSKCTWCSNPTKSGNSCSCQICGAKYCSSNCKKVDAKSKIDANGNKKPPHKKTCKPSALKPSASNTIDPHTMRLLQAQKNASNVPNLMMNWSLENQRLTQRATGQNLDAQAIELCSDLASSEYLPVELKEKLVAECTKHGMSEPEITNHFKKLMGMFHSQSHKMGFEIITGDGSRRFITELMYATKIQMWYLTIRTKWRLLMATKIQSQTRGYLQRK